MLKVGDVYTVTIEDANVFGNGICRVDGVAVFVEGGITGEKCEIVINRVHSKYAYARAINVLEKSKHRIKAACPYFGKCGGCTFGDTTLDLENEIKQNYVKSAFIKQGITAEFEKIACPVSENYRNKVVLFYKNGRFGYMKRDTNDIIPHEGCLLNSKVFDEIAAFTAEHMRTTSLRALYLRKSSCDTQIMVCPIFRKSEDMLSYVSKLVGKFPNVKSVLCAINKDKDFVLENCNFKVIYGDGYITDTLCGLSFRISAESFYQVNHDCAQLLYEKAISLCELDKTATCADLFCGTGTIGIITAHKTGATVYGVEIVEKAVTDAKFNAKTNGISNAYFKSEDASKFDKKTDVCIIDPPRKGCSPYMIDTLKRLKPQRIVYVSCNVDTMTRDIRALSKEYEISAPVSVFNLFPRTSHVESVVRLTRTSVKDK